MEHLSAARSQFYSAVDRLAGKQWRFNVRESERFDQAIDAYTLAVQQQLGSATDSTAEHAVTMGKSASAQDKLLPSDPPIQQARERHLAAMGRFRVSGELDPAIETMDELILAVQSSHASQIQEMVSVLKKACDRTWTDETPWQVANVAANAIYWRDREIELEKAQIVALEQQLKEKEELLRASPTEADRLADLRGDVWRPIATAPTNGRNILAYCGRVKLAFWDIARGGIWSEWPGRERIHPSHWQPLPPPPAPVDATSKCWSKTGHCVNHGACNATGECIQKPALQQLIDQSRAGPVQPQEPAKATSASASAKDTPSIRQQIIQAGWEGFSGLSKDDENSVNGYLAAAVCALNYVKAHANASWDRVVTSDQLDALIAEIEQSPGS